MGVLPLFELASGGMGSVAVALREEGAFRRLVAMKRPHTREEHARKMFVEEARVAGLIRHANVVSVLDVGEDDEGPYLLMDYVEGPALSALLRRLGKQGRMLPLQSALDIGRQIARGLHAAHELRDPKGRPLNLVHRDVSPENVLLGFDGLARLTDFGIAKAEGRSHEHTEEGVLKGKMGYMAPELLRFDDPSVQSDLFAFGVLLFEMLSGRRLYSRKGGSAREVARRILNEAPPDLGDLRDDVPPELDALLFELMAKDPAQRPQNAAVVSETLEALWAQRVAIDGRLPLQDLVAHHFDEWRQERTDRIEAAVAAFDVPADAGTREDTSDNGRSSAAHPPNPDDVHRAETRAVPHQELSENGPREGQGVAQPAPVESAETEGTTELATSQAPLGRHVLWTAGLLFLLGAGAAFVFFLPAQQESPGETLSAPPLESDAVNGEASAERAADVTTSAAAPPAAQDNVEPAADESALDESAANETAESEATPPQGAEAQQGTAMQRRPRRRRTSSERSDDATHSMTERPASQRSASMARPFGTWEWDR